MRSRKGQEQEEQSEKKREKEAPEDLCTQVERTSSAHLDNAALVGSSKAEVAQVGRAELNVANTLRAAPQEGLTHQSFPDILLVRITYITVSSAASRMSSKKKWKQKESTELKLM